MNHPIVNGISDLFWQIFTGHSEVLNATMWFQTNLIVISLFFFIVFYLFNEKVGLTIIVICSFGCLFLQYSGINYQMFGALRFELTFPLGRLSEMIPIATFGFITARFDLIRLFRKNCFWNLIVMCFLSVIFIVFDHKLFIVSSSFGYAGIWKIFVGYSLTSFAYNCKLEKFKEKYPLFSQLITKHTLEIYCGHMLIAFLLFNTFSMLLGIQTGLFYQCVLIYILGFIAFEIISRIPLPWIRYVI
jgi:hypothetical protein